MSGSRALSSLPTSREAGVERLRRTGSNSLKRSKPLPPERHSQNFAVGHLSPPVGCEKWPNETAKGKRKQIFVVLNGVLPHSR